MHIFDSINRYSETDNDSVSRICEHNIYYTFNLNWFIFNIFLFQKYFNLMDCFNVFEQPFTMLTNGICRRFHNIISKTGFYSFYSYCTVQANTAILNFSI